MESLKHLYNSINGDTIHSILNMPGVLDQIDPILRIDEHIANLDPTVLIQKDIINNDPMELLNSLNNNSNVAKDEEEEQILKLEEEIVIELLQLQNDDLKPTKKRKRNITEPNFWESQWGLLITNKNVRYPQSKEGKLFRRRFRLPYPLFQYLASLCKEFNIFDSIYTTRIPIEAKLLGCLRILGRDACADDITEITGNTLGESTMNYVFKKFIHGFQSKLYPLIVYPAKGEYLQEVMNTYAALGLPGAIGSMDCTHVKWVMCPKRKKFPCKGLEGFPTLAFQVVVDHNRRVQSVSQSFLGATPDKSICGNHLFSLAAQHGSLEELEYELYDTFGNKYRCKGGYIIVDGGYIDCICFIDPDKYRMDKTAVLWSEWLESVRKDVECFFGVIKIRFRYCLDYFFLIS